MAAERGNGGGTVRLVASQAQSWVANAPASGAAA